MPECDKNCETCPENSECDRATNTLEELHSLSMQMEDLLSTHFNVSDFIKDEIYSLTSEIQTEIDRRERGEEKF